MLEVSGLSLDYGERTVLKGLNFLLKPNRVYGIFGYSGVGKSSLLRIIAGYQDPKAGKVHLNGKCLPLSSQRLVPGFPEISLVTTDNPLDWNHTCEENIREAILGWSIPKRTARVQELLQGLGLTSVKNIRAKRLSDGEKQRLAIARALANKPEWLLLDEPFGHLDFSNKKKILQQIFRLGMYNVLMVSHDVQDLMAHCDQIAVLNHLGKLSKFEKPQRKYFNLKHRKSAELMGPVNALEVNGIRFLFRPNAFTQSEHGIELTRSSLYFNGMVYVHYFCSANNEEVVLYFREPLPETVKILPFYETT